MIDARAPSELPSPAQMQALHIAEHAAWQARRMADASQALRTGGVAYYICLMGAALTLVHANDLNQVSPWIALALIYCAGLGGVSWLWRTRKHAPVEETVTVTTIQEDAVRSSSHRVKTIAFALTASVVMLAVWAFAFRHLSPWAMLASLALAPVFGAAFFVIRYAMHRFPEDLVFAACIAGAFAPFFARVESFWGLVCLPPLLVVVLATASLRRRWTTWTQHIAEHELDIDASERQP